MNGPKEVDEFIDSLSYELKPIVIQLRSIILSANRGITEHIKWNAPSFCINGEDRVTMNLRSDKFVEIVFHRGAKVNKTAFKFEESTGLLTWLSPDRGSIKFSSIEAVNSNLKEFIDIVNRWMEATK